MRSAPIQLTTQLHRFYESRAGRGQPLALLIVVATTGSTYSKAGQVMFADAGGETEGMLSGGCLEGDLAERAKAAIESGTAQVAEYDLVDDDELFGLGVGCEGAMYVLVQPLGKDDDYAPVSGLLEQLQSSCSVDVDLATFGSSLRPDLAYTSVRIERPKRVLILGGGSDASPIVDFAGTLGWHVRVVDRSVDDDDVPGIIVEGDYDAAIVKNHNLQRDREHLRLLAPASIPFIGLLGPPRRCARVLDDCADIADALGDRLQTPVGRRIGGRGPAAIALEIVAELQAFFTLPR